MTWLIVLGNSSWRPDRHHRFDAGVHEVSDEIAQLARESGSKKLVVMDERPVIVQEEEGPLSLENLRRGTSGIELAQPERAVELPQLEVPRDWRCIHCPSGEGDFPSKGALERHVKIHHP